MLGGVDLVRRVNGRQTWALCWPLLTAPDGTKLGKTTGARIWLDADRTSPYQFFQHWMATDDRQVRQFLAQFTLLPIPEIDEAAAAHADDPGRREAQRLLAREATALVHGEAEAEAAEAASGILFGAPLQDASVAALGAVAREVPVAEVDRTDLDGGITLVDLLADDGLLTASKGEARRAITQGGVYLNGERVTEDRKLATSDLLHGRWALLRKGKKAYAMVDVGP